MPRNQSSAKRELADAINQLAEKVASNRVMRKQADFGSVMSGAGNWLKSHPSMGGAAIGAGLGGLGGALLGETGPDGRKRRGSGFLTGALSGAGIGAGAGLMGDYLRSRSGSASPGGDKPQITPELIEAQRASENTAPKLLGRWGVDFAKRHPLLSMFGAVDAGQQGLGRVAEAVRPGSGLDPNHLRTGLERLTGAGGLLEKAPHVLQLKELASATPEVRRAVLMEVNRLRENGNPNKLMQLVGRFAPAVKPQVDAGKLVSEFVDKMPRGQRIGRYDIERGVEDAVKAVSSPEIRGGAFGRHMLEAADDQKITAQNIADAMQAASPGKFRAGTAHDAYALTRSPLEALRKKFPALERIIGKSAPYNPAAFTGHSMLPNRVGEIANTAPIEGLLGKLERAPGNMSSAVSSTTAAGKLLPRAAIYGLPMLMDFLGHRAQAGQADNTQLNELLKHYQK